MDTTNLGGACRERSATQPVIAFVRRDGERREWHELWDFAGEMVVRHVEVKERGQGGRDRSLEIVSVEAQGSERTDIGEGRRDGSGEAIVAEAEALNVARQKRANIGRDGACECIVCKADG